MRYRSNLLIPDLRTQFRLLDPPRLICGHDAPSDPDFEPGCCFWTDDEAAILFHVAQQIKGRWVDIGARFGWTAAHLFAAGAEEVTAVDPEYENPVIRKRLLALCYRGLVPLAMTAADFFGTWPEKADGFVIDGDHDDPQPTCDALGCLKVDKPDCVILLHDFRGKPIQDAVMTLIHEGFRCRIYDTPNGVSLCWRGYPDFIPPYHAPDPEIDWAAMRERITGFDWSKTE